MADDESSESFWKVLGDQVKSPWDWVVAGIGAVAGGGASVYVGGTDLGASVGAGAIAGVTARKAAVASLQGRAIRKQAVALKDAIKRRVPASESAMLQARIDAEIELWDVGAMKIDEFDKHLKECRQEYRTLVVAAPFSATPEQR